MTLDPSEASALAASIAALEEKHGRPSTISHVARLALRRLCPHPKEAQATYIGLRLDCAICGAVLSIGPGVPA